MRRVGSLAITRSTALAEPAVTDPTRLSTLDDSRLDDYRDLRERDLSRERGAFIAEGFEVLKHLVASEVRVRSVLCSEARWARVAPLVASLPAEVPRIVLPEALMSAVVGFPVHRGILASGTREDLGRAETLDALPEGPCALLALQGLSNHDNVGACFRNAAAFGAHAVVLDAESADPLYRKAIRVSMGHVLRVPFTRRAPSEFTSALRARGFATVALTPRRDAAPVDAFLSGARPFPDRFALLVGAEGAGLPDASIASADLAIQLPMAGGTDSLNAATAAAVALHALRYVSPSSFAGTSSTRSLTMTPDGAGASSGSSDSSAEKNAR